MLFRLSSPARTGPSALAAFQKKRLPFLRIGIGFCALLVLGGILLGPGNTSVVHAASISLPYNDNGNSENPPLVFYNAIQQYTGSVVVQHHPKVYLLFWGPEWSQDPDGVINQVLRTFRALPGSQYNNILAQYSDASDYVHNDVQVVASVIDTAAPPSNLDIGFDTPAGLWFNAQARYEADKAIAANNWQITPDSQIIVFPQKGSTYNHGSGFCGVHSYDSADITMNVSPYAYALIQYGDQNSGCDPTGSVAEDIAMSAVHEYTEMATDPRIFVSPTLGGNWYVAYGAGWHTEDGTKSTPQEVADLCEGYNSSSYAYQDYQDPASGTSYTLPLLWSNASNSCVTAVGQDYASPASPGRHTVQNKILAAYQSGGADSGALGSPVTEETAIGHGRVSYFNGQCGGASKCVGIYWEPGLSAAYWVRGSDFSEYQSVGEAASVIGFPVANEEAMKDSYTSVSGSAQYFDGTCAVTAKCAGIYWSGPTGSHLVWGGDYQEYVNVGEAKGVVGFPTSDQVGVTDPFTNVSGSEQYFTERCSGDTSCAGIYWSDLTGSHLVWGGDYTEYVNVNGATGVAGFPTSDQITMNGGSVQYFTGRCSSFPACAGIYWSNPTGSHLVWGGDYQLYSTLGEANGILGFPTTDQLSIDGGSVQYFTINNACSTPGPSNSDGAIYYSASTDSHEVHGCIYGFYQQFGGLNSVLGFPVSDEEGINDYWGDPGRVSYFQGAYCGNTGPNGSNSAIYWWSGAHEVQGCIYAKYQQLGGPNSKLGFPISNEYTNSLGYRESDFSNGEIVWENGTAVVTFDTSCVTTGKCN